MPRHTEVGAPWGEGGATREQLLSSEPTGSAGGRPGGRRGKQPASSIVRRYLDEGLRASLASRSTEATIARVDAAADLDEMLDVHDEPWLQPSVQESLGKVWAAFVGPDAAAAAPETVGAIVDATLPGLVSVIAQEHTHGIKSSLWRRFEEYSNTIEGVRSKPPFEREYGKLCRIVHNHTESMFERDFTGGASRRFRTTISNMLAILGDRPAGSDVPRAAFLEGYHRSLMAIILSEERAVELGGVVIEASRLLVEAVNANVEEQLERKRRYRPCLTCMLPCGVFYFRDVFPFCLTYSCY